MYSHIMGMDDELWDILEEGVGDLKLDEEGAALDRKAHIAEQKKLYKKHHMTRGILVAALPHKEYIKMSDKSTAKAMFASLCSLYEGNKKVREAKATMLVHQYELFRMKEDENIETMYSRFQTLVSGLQIPKKSYVASDHVNKILRSLPAKWRPKVTAIEEAKDINTLSVEDLISSLKCHEIGLNEHEPMKKPKSIALKSRGKPTKALKAIEFEEESTSEDSDEDPAIVKEMAMLSNRLQYLAKKNKKFMSRGSSHKSSRREKQKGCFNCKKTRHFSADCPELQKEQSKEKSKKPVFKSNKFKKQIKKSLMATWEDLDNESESDKDDAEDEANIAMALVATVEDEKESSDAESCTDSEDETEVYSKLTRFELIDSLKELLGHYENQSSELRKVKQRYIKLLRLQYSTKNELDVLQYKYNNLKIMTKKGYNKPMFEHDVALQEFITTRIDRTKVASMIYSINQNNKKGIGFTGGNSSEVILKPCSDKKELKIHFVSETEKVNTASCSELEASSSKVMTKSKPRNQETKVMNNSKSKASKLQILKRSEPNKQVLKKIESEIQKPRFQRKKAVCAKLHSKTEVAEPEVWKKTKQDNFRQRTQTKFKTPRINPRGPIKIWVPKSDIVDVAGVSKRKRKAEVLVPGKWLLATHDGRKVYVPNPDHERGRNCGIWRKPNWQNHWYWNNW